MKTGVKADVIRVEANPRLLLQIFVTNFERLLTRFRNVGCRDRNVMRSGDDRRGARDVNIFLEDC